MVTICKKVFTSAVSAIVTSQCLKDCLVKWVILYFEKDCRSTLLNVVEIDRLHGYVLMNKYIFFMYMWHQIFYYTDVWLFTFKRRVCLCYEWGSERLVLSFGLNSIPLHQYKHPVILTCLHESIWQNQTITLFSCTNKWYILVPTNSFTVIAWPFRKVTKQQDCFSHQNWFWNMD